MKRQHLFAGALMAVGAGGLVIGAALAQPPEGGPGPMTGGDRFERADTNGDGVITAEELEAARLQAFEQMDADGDGYITDIDRETMKAQKQDQKNRVREKIRAKMEARRQAHLEKVDLDSDGRISREEFMTAEGGMLAGADTDGDGTITAAEAEAAKADMKSKHQKWRKKKKETDSSDEG